MRAHSAAASITRRRCIAAATPPQLLAVGDAAGVLRLYELPRTLRRPLPNERRLMAAFVAREAARCEDVAARQVRGGRHALRQPPP